MAGKSYPPYFSVRCFILESMYLTIKKRLIGKKVAKDGVEFAIIRLGYRGWSDGALYMDTCFVQNIKGEQAAGIDENVDLNIQMIAK